MISPNYNLHVNDVTNSIGFFKNGPISASFCLFSSFPHYTILQIDESVDGVLGTRIWGGRMEGTDESTELCWQPRLHDFLLRFLS